VIVLLLAVGLWKEKFGLTMIWGAVALIVGSIVADTISGSVTFSSLVLQRLLATPGLLTGYYMQFFSGNPKMLLSHSVLKSLVENPYGSQSPPFIIGSAYFHNASNSANANIWADA